MTRTSFDTFSKQLLEEFLSPFGSVELNREIAGESRFIDVWFSPSTTPDPDLGLLGRIATTSCLIEPYRNAPRFSEVRACLLKLFLVQANQQRQARREETPFPDTQLPYLWILTPTASENFLASFGTVPNSDWMPGIHTLPTALRTSIVAIHQLPKTPETLWLRLLGKGQVQQQAVEEVLALPETDFRRLRALDLLMSWRITIEVETLDQEERDVYMALSEAYLQWKEQTKQEGRQQGRQEGRQEGRREIIETLLRSRFGELDDQLAEIVPLILTRSPEEFTPLLLNLSREELLRYFQVV